jgi:hypothetical protein
MPAEARESRTPGRGLSDVGDGTEATTRRKLSVTPDSLALHPGGAIKTGGSTAGDVQGAGETVDGGSESRAPINTSLLTYQAVMRKVKRAAEALLPKVDIELRADLAIAICEMNHILRGGVR